MFKSKVIKFFNFVLIFVAIDLYVWQGIKFLIRNLESKKQKLIFKIYWGYSILVFLFMMSTRYLPNLFPKSALQFIGSFVFCILLFKLIWVIFLLIDDIIRLFRWIVSFKQKKAESVEQESGISRLKFIQYLGLGFGSLFIGGAILGVVKGAHNYQIHRKRLKIDGLPNAFKGTTILQISDVHCGSFWDREAVKKGIDLINQQNADYIFFTGDFVNNTSDEAVEWIDVFKNVKAKNKVFSTLGNHDYGDYAHWNSDKEKQENLDKLIQYHADMGWDLLMDEHRIIEKDGEQIAVLGIQNWSAKKNFPKYGNLEKAYKGTEEVPVKLLLSHDPSHWRAEVLNHKPDIKAMFSGHTHGMQFGIDTRFYKWSPVKFIYDEWIDLYTENNQHLYVNRGFGYLGYPGRMGVFPEITVFTLA